MVVSWEWHRRRLMPEASRGGFKCDEMHESRKSRHEWFRGYKASPAKRRTGETSDESGPLPVPKSAWVASGRRHHRLRMLVDHSLCRDGRSEESFQERRTVRTLAARRNSQTALGNFFKIVQKRTLSRVKHVKIDGALVARSNDCFVQVVQHYHVSRLLAAVMDRWPSSSRFVSRTLPDFHRCLSDNLHLRTPEAMPTPVYEGIAARFTLPNRLHLPAFVSILLVVYLRPSELLALRKVGLVPPRVSHLPCGSVAIATSQTGVSFG